MRRPLRSTAPSRALDRHRRARQLLDEIGGAHRAGSALGARDGAYRLVQAMYLRCPDICPLAMSRLQRLAAALSDVPPSRLQAVSVSVDRDAPDRLRAVWEAYGSPPNWSFVTPADGAGDEALLDLGIWLYRRPDGLINHGVDIFVLDPEGRVVRILPANEDLDRLAAAAREMAG